MRERVLAIVNLIAQYVLGAEEAPVCERELISELMAAGYSAEEIEDAFSWMEATAIRQPSVQSTVAFSLSAPGYRIFSAQEERLLSVAARGFLVRIRAMGLLPGLIQEEIIDRAIRAAEDPVTEQEIKLITILTLLLRSSDIWQREIDCLLENDWKRMYH
ncbi:MAG: DUF494 family protein [Pelovirga sp.]